MDIALELTSVSREELMEVNGQLVSLVEVQEARIAELEGQQKPPTYGLKVGKAPGWVKANRPARP